MKDTNSGYVFCKVVSGEFSYKIYEDDKHLAILDLYPNVKAPNDAHNNQRAL